jgi:hypothetical protein
VAKYFGITSARTSIEVSPLHTSSAQRLEKEDLADQIKHMEEAAEIGRQVGID